MYVEVLEILIYFILQHIKLVKELTKDDDNKNIGNIGSKLHILEPIWDNLLLAFQYSTRIVKTWHHKETIKYDSY